MSWPAVLAAIAIAGCGSGHPNVVSNSGARKPHMLFPAKLVDCTKDGWCRIADPPPIHINSLWVSDNALYAAGYAGEPDTDANTARIARWNGTAWKVWKLEGAVMLSIDGVSDGAGDRVFASGRKTRVYRLVGDAWQGEGQVFTEETQVAVTADDAFVTINGNILERGANAEWRLAFTEPGTSIHDSSIYDLDSDDAGGVWAVVRHRESTQLYSWNRLKRTFEPVGEHHDLYRLSARTPNDVAVCGGGVLRRFDGHTWRVIPFDLHIGNSALTHRGNDLVILGAIDEHHSAVAIVGANGTQLQRLPDDSDALAAGPDSSLWAASGSNNALWFLPR